MRCTVLCGGFGGARLAMALTEAGLAPSATFVTNVADDWQVGDLLVCPDTDAVHYALAGLFDDDRGWGVRGDRFPGPEPGEPAWFNIGADDRARHRERRRLLRDGMPLSAATAELARRAGVIASIVPVSDLPMRTMVEVAGRQLDFQEWLIRAGAPVPSGVALVGEGRTAAAPGVVEAIAAADLVVLASSSPVASLEPVLSVAGVREALRARRGPVVALSPLVLGRALTDERDVRRARARAALMACRGIAHDPRSVARWLDGVATHFVLDPTDADLADAVRAAGGRGLRIELAPVIGSDAGDRAELVGVLRSVASSVARGA